ncbi:hypothetical protein L512_4859 [Bordetella bronchiseptica MBORD624]|nr:hypothetical protein L512_4859 [Bordetella bronchiseptica MBORD624]
MTAVLLAHEGAMLAARTGDARRLLLSWMVLMHRIEHAEPFDGEHARRESRAADLLLDVDRPVTLEALHAVTGMLDANAA